MRQLVVLMALAGVALGMPQGARHGADNTFTKILSFESYQDGHNFGHELLQEDGTTAGQKFGPDGLLYGFYSYIQQDGNRVKVLWRAGPGVGYEVIGVEGLDKDNLGNLRATINTDPQFQPPPSLSTVPALSPPQPQWSPIMPQCTVPQSIAPQCTPPPPSTGSSPTPSPSSPRR